MAFRLHDNSGYQDFDDGATYTFNEAGLLVIHLSNNGSRLTYSPHAWNLVEESDTAGDYAEAGRRRYE